MNKIERSATLVPAVGAQVDQGVRPLPTSAAVAIIYPRDVPHVDVLSWRKRPKTAGEYLLYTEDQVADAVAAERERIVCWLETQRNETPATGKEFAQALRFCGPNV